MLLLKIIGAVVGLLVMAILYAILFVPGGAEFWRQINLSAWQIYIGGWGDALLAMLFSIEWHLFIGLVAGGLFLLGCFFSWPRRGNVGGRADIKHQELVLAINELTNLSRAGQAEAAKKLASQLQEICKAIHTAAVNAEIQMARGEIEFAKAAKKLQTQTQTALGLANKIHALQDSANADGQFEVALGRVKSIADKLEAK